MKPRRISRLAFPLASAIAALLAMPAVQAANLYWDTNSTTTGLGDTAGTWGTSTFWGTAANNVILNGTATTANTATGGGDAVLFGTSNLALGSTASTIGIVGGGVTINTIVFGAGQGAQAVTLSSGGGTITLAGGSPTISVNRSAAADTIAAVLAGTAGMVKAGTGTLNLTATNTFTGGLTIAGGGTLQLGNGTSGSLASQALSFNNGGGVLNVQSASTGSTQAMGALTFSSTGAGESTVRSTYGSSGNAALTFSSLAARGAGAAGNFVVSGGSNGTTNKIVLTGAATGTLLDRGCFFNGGSYASYDVTGFVRAYGVGDSNYLAAPAGSTIGSPTSSSNVHLTSGNITAQTAASANTINLGANSITMTGASTLLQTNGLLSSGSASATIGGGTTPLLQSATSGGEVVVRVDGGSDQLTVSSGIQNNTTASPLTKSGAGTLVLSGANTHTGNTTINSGTLAVSGGSAIADTGAVVLANAAGATFQLNGSETIGNLSGGGFSGGNVNVGANTLTIADNTATTFGGTFIGAGGVTKTGSGILTLSNVNTFAGTLAINAGQVTFTHGDAGGVNPGPLSSGGTISMAGGTAINLNHVSNVAAGVLHPAMGNSVGGFSFANAINVSSGTASIQTSSASGANDWKWTFSGGVTGGTSGAQTLAIVPGGGTTLSQGDRHNLLFSGIIADGAGGTLGVNADFKGGSGTGQELNVNLSASNTFTGPISVSNTRGLVLSYNGPTGNNGGGYLAIGGQINRSFYTGRTITVGTGTLGSGNYTNTISLAAGTALDYVSSANQTLGGVISGGGGLIMEGTGVGTLSLSAANTFTGGIFLRSGILQLATGGSLSDTGAINVNGGTFDIQTVSDSVGVVTLTSGTITGSSGVLSASSFAMQGGTVSAILGGGGTLTKSTTGTTILSGANTYSGTTTVSAGTLTLDYSSQNNSKLSNSAALILGGGTVNLTGGTHTEEVGSTTLLAGTASNITRSSIDSILQLGNITANPGAALNIGAANIATTNNLNNSIGILGSWATVGGSAWAVNSTNGPNGLITAASFTDVTRLSSGTKTITSGAGHTRIIEGTGTVGDITMPAPGTTSTDTLVNTANGGAVNVSVGTGNTLSTAAILQAIGAGALTIGTFGTAGTLTALSAGGDLGVVSNSVNGLTINSVIADNTSASTLTKEGTGIVSLSGANTYSGGTNVNVGVLAIGQNNGGTGGDNSSPDGTSTSLGSGAVNVAAGAALHINSAGLTIANNITLNGLSYGANSGGPTATNNGPWNGAIMAASETGVHSNTFTGSITLNATSNVSTNWNDKTMILTGKVTGAGGLVIDNSAPTARRGSLIRLDNNTNDYAGDTTINNGNTVGAQPTLILGASNVIPDGTGKGNLSVLGNLNLNSFSETVNGLSGSGPISNGIAATTSTLTVGNNNATGLTYSGIISNGTGTVALVKTGSGTQTLSGVSTFTGGTTVNQGTLALAAVGAASGYIRGTLTINTGATVTPLFATTGWGLGFGAGTSVNTININGGQLLFTGTANNGGTAASTINMTAGTIGGSGGNTFDWYFGNTTTPSLNTLASASSATISANINLRLNSNLNALTFDVANGAAANDLFVSGNILASNSGDGFGRIVKTGAGVMVVSGTNTYAGGTTISNGTLEVRNSSALGSGSASVAAGARLMLNAGNLTIANNITLNGTTPEGAIYSGLQGPGNVANLTGIITLNATSNVSNWWNDKTVQFSGKITGAGGLEFVTQSTPGAGGLGGRFLISGATNDYAGATTVTGTTTPQFGFIGQAMLYLGATNALPTTTALTLNNADLYLNGQSQTLPSISGSGSFSVQNGSTTAASLTLGAADTTSAFNGAIKDNGIIVTNTASTSPTAPVTVGKVSLTKIGTGTLTLGGINTYSGNTSVNAGTLALADNAQLKFVLGATSGTNNSITGAGTVSLEGDFVIDTTAADALASGSWTLENVPSLGGAYGSNFTVVGFTNAGSNKWTKPNGAKTYTFDETTGILTLAAGGNYASWASLNGAGPNLGDDHDNDGVDNGTEYFIGGPTGNTTGFTALPGVTNTLGTLSVTWPKAAGYTGTYGTHYFVETSDTLVGAWSPEAADPSPGFTVTFPSATEVKYTFPAPVGKKFVRLKVTGP